SIVSDSANRLPTVQVGDHQAYLVIRDGFVQANEDRFDFFHAALTGHVVDLPVDGLGNPGGDGGGPLGFDPLGEVFHNGCAGAAGFLCDLFGGPAFAEEFHGFLAQGIGAAEDWAVNE